MLSKKLLFAGLIAAGFSSTPLWAFDGFYVAGSLQLVDFAQDEDISHLSFGDDKGPQGGDFDLGENGIGAGVAVGYGFETLYEDYPDWALDLEIFYQQASNDPEVTVPPVLLNSAEFEGTYGFRAKPGYFLASNVKFFVPMAILQSQIDNTFAINGNSKSADENVTGFELGVGIETMLTEDASIALSASRTFYDDYDQSFAIPSEGDTIGITEENTPSATTGSLTFIYRFASM